MRVTSQIARPIVALQGAPSAVIQALLADFATRMRASGLKVAGVVELTTECDADACGRLSLRDLSDWSLIPISQNLGRGSTACNLDPRGLAQACASVERAVDAGVDLVVLSKFGKQEAARGGLSDAFRAAVAAGVPVVTAVSPAVSSDWRAFADEYAEFLDVNAGSLDDWWARLARNAIAVAAE